MYKLNIIDERNNIFEALSFRKESDMDSFTSYFKNEDELLESLGLNSIIFRVEVKNVDKNKDKDMVFINRDNRYVIDLYDDNSKRNKLVSDMVDCDKEEISRFFLQEMLYRYDNEPTDHTSEKMDEIIRYLDEEEAYEDRYDEEMDNFKYNLKRKINDYLLFKGKPVYHEFKEIYTYFTSLRLIPRVEKKLTEEDIKTRNYLVLGIKNNISKIIEIGETSFIDGILPSGKKQEEEKDNYIFPKSYDDVEDYRTDLDQYADEEGMSEDEKREFIKKNMKRF